MLHSCASATSRYLATGRLKTNCPQSRIEVRPTVLPSLLTVIYDFDFQLSASCGQWSWSTHAKSQGQTSLGSKDIVETDGRTRPIALPCPLTRLVIITRCQNSAHPGFSGNIPDSHHGRLFVTSAWSEDWRPHGVEYAFITWTRWHRWTRTMYGHNESTII